MAATAVPPATGPWRVATRRSALARAQAQQVADALAEVTGRPAELVPMSTTGDEHPERAFEAFDTKGLFVDNTRRAVLSGDCHFVVHSYKDLPNEAAPGLVIAAVPRRVDPRDALITREGHRLANLPRDRPVIVGTSSARRKAQLQRSRRDVLVQPIRGNLDTRLGKVAGGELDGVVVAMAGLIRMGGSDLDLRVVPLEHGEMLHAAAQGALAIECRGDDAATRKALRRLDHPDTRVCVTAERELLAHLGGGCTSPIGAHAELVPGESDGTRRIELLGMMSDPNGTRLFRASHQAAASEPELLGRTLAASLIAARQQAEGPPGHGHGGH
ncbi:MAG: hydroxymethylbilane synthase [Actinobacteria bacterium]|nr:hydroxymethylbilane synthase [Actinomycetota bacterium]